MTFNNSLNPSLINLEGIDEVFSLTIDVFDLAYREIDPSKFEFKWEAIEFEPIEGRILI